MPLAEGRADPVFEGVGVTHVTCIARKLAALEAEVSE